MMRKVDDIMICLYDSENLLDKIDAGSMTYKCSIVT